MDIIDLEREDLLRVAGITEADADEVLRLIESLTVEEGGGEDSAGGDSPSEQDLAEARELAADILGLPLPPLEPTRTTAPRSEARGPENDAG